MGALINGCDECCVTLFVGYPPFCSSTPQETYRKVMSWRKSLLFPAEIPISENARHLIRNLCSDADRRLGIHGAEAVRQHPFLNSVDWEHIRERPSAIPVQVRSIDDTSNFDEFPELDRQWRKLVLTPRYSACDTLPVKLFCFQLPVIRVTRKHAATTQKIWCLSTTLIKLLKV